MAIVMGIDIGQRRDHSAICVAQSESRETEGRSAVHYIVRHLERSPVGTSFPAVAKRVGEVAARSQARSCDGSPGIYVDATGAGMPVVNLVAEAVDAARAVIPVYFTHGDRRTESEAGWRREVVLGKAYLVSRLQVLLQAGRLHLPRTAEAERSAVELLEYEIKVADDANERYGAFSVGAQDDLVTALGLAVQQEPIGPGIY